MNGLQRSYAYRGDVETHVLLGLGDLDHRESSRFAEWPSTADTRIGAFDCFDGQYGAVFDNDALADVQTAHLFGDLPTKGDVLVLLFSQTASERAFLDKQLWGKSVAGVMVTP